MKNIFNVSDEEKNRIRNLHLTESGNKKISSRLNEQERLDGDVEMVGGDERMAKPKNQMANPKSSNSPCPPTNAQSPYYTNYPEFCYKQGGVYIYQQQGGAYANHPDGNCCDNGPSSFRCHPVQGCININQQGGQFVTMQDCLNSGCLPQTNNEHCVCCDGQNALGMSTAVPVGDCPTHNFGPQYTNCVSATGPQPNCGTSGGVTHYCVNCAQQTMATYNTSTSQGCPQGYVDMGPNIPTNGPCVQCANLNCQAAGWNGPFNSMADCQASNCSPQTEHECVNGACVQQNGGQFADMAACQASGCGGQDSYDCTDWADPNGCQQVSGPGGQFPTLDDCLTSPCQCDDVISSWPLYTNNPNYATGDWSSSSHDGPSNNNAIQGQLDNLQNNANYPGGNPVQEHKMRCKEAAMLHWLNINSGGACAICSDPNFAVGPGDPLGCVSQTLINSMTTFNTNSPGWPGQGCSWLNNSLSQAQTQQLNYQPGSVAYCKIQGKIDFLVNYKLTGQSTYVPGQASFPLPCV